MKLQLSQDEIDNLKKLHKSAKDKKTAYRINTIILLYKGYSQKQIADILLLNEDTISNWIQKYKKSSTLRYYLDDNYTAYQGRLTKEELSQLKQYVKENYIFYSDQIISYIREKFKKEYSNSGVKNLLHSLGFVHKQLDLFSDKADVEAQKQFVAEYEEINSKLLEEEELLFMDGVHPQHNTSPSKCWIEKGEIKYQNCNTGRKRINLNGVYNPNNQDVIIREDESINAQSTIKLFEMIEEKYSDKKRIIVFSDNATYYKCTLVKAYLENSKIELINLPPYSPNLNLIERLWKLLKKEVIKNKYHEKFVDFKTAIMGFFDKIENRKEKLKQFIGTKFHIIDPNFNPKTNIA